MAGQPKTKKNSVSSGRVKKTEMPPIVSKAIKDECPTLTTPDVEEAKAGRRAKAFAANKLRLEALISEDCHLSDIERAITPPTCGAQKLPTLDYVVVMDGSLDVSLKHDYMDFEDRARALSYYKRGVVSALKEAANVVSDQKLVEHIISCQKLIAILLQETVERVSAVESIDAAEMAARVSFYFDDCDKRHRSYTVPGLAYAIGFMHRKHLLKFVADNEESISAYIIARALMKIEDQRNIEIISGGGMMAGHKLDLATNFDWNDAKAKPSKDDASVNITHNTINMNSLPPAGAMTVEEWQRQFLTQKSAPIDVGPSTAEPAK